MSIEADPTVFMGRRVLVSGDTKGAGRATVDRFVAGGGLVTLTDDHGLTEPNVNLLATEVPPGAASSEPRRCGPPADLSRAS